MGIKKIIFLFYLMYTCYTIFVCGSTNLSFLYMFSALIFLWLMYFSLSLGYFYTNTQSLGIIDNNFCGIKLEKARFIQLFILGIGSIVISIIAAKFYTGQTPVTIFNNLIARRSNYIIYQNYFQKSNIKNLSWNKLYYILLLGIKNIIFVYSYILIICKSKKIKIVQIFYLLILAISHLYFGVARGTNFEAYQLFLILSYCYIMRQKIQNKKINLLIIILLGLILVGVFIKVLSARNSKPDYVIAEHILYDIDEIFPSIFPTLTLYGMFLHSYLGFGLYYIATLINKIWFNSLEELVRAFIPMKIFFPKLENTIDKVNEIVVIGVKWVPDAVTIMDNIGILGLFFICFLLGSILKKLSPSENKYNKYLLLFGYCIFIFFISIPNGHFLGFSSEKILLSYIFFDFIYYFLKKRGRTNEKSMSYNK